MSDKFGFVMPGQPPSWNHMYRWTTSKQGHRIQVKTNEANLYQSQLTMIARSMRPSSFQPKGQVIVAYEMLLGRSLDADNVMKAVHDALSVALGIDDKRFLPIVLSKVSGVSQPSVGITLFDAEVWQPAVIPGYGT